MDSQQYAVIGGDSAIGAELVRSLRADGHRVLVTTRRHDRVDHSWMLPGDHCVYLDLRTGGLDYEWPHPEVAFICAGVSGERCTADDRPVNVESTLAIAKMFRDLGTHVVFPSTTRPPICEYARQKRDVEESLLDSGGASIVRLGKVLTPGFPLFAEWAARLRNFQPIECRADLSLSPITLGHAVAALRNAGERRISDRMTVSANAAVTYFDIGIQLAKQIGAGSHFVLPILSPRMPIAEERCCNCHTLGIIPASPWVAVDEAFALL